MSLHSQMCQTKNCLEETVLAKIQVIDGGKRRDAEKMIGNIQDESQAAEGYGESQELLKPPGGPAQSANVGHRPGFDYDPTFH